MPKVSSQFLREMIDAPSSPQGKKFSYLVNCLIILSVVNYSISTLPDLSENWRRASDIFELFTILIFSFEYLLRVSFTNNKLKYITSFWGIIDLLSFVPFYIYLFTGVDARVLNVMRLFRILRLFKLFRYSSALHRVKIAFQLIRHELVLFGSAATILLFMAGAGIYYFERDVQPESFQSVFDGLWWGIITITTIGYGDVVPVSAGGKLFTSLIALISLGIVSVPSGLIASGMMEARKIEESQNRKADQQRKAGTGNNT